MASAQVWFSHTVTQTHANGTHTLTRWEENVFVGSPVWNIMSWDKAQYSIPQPDTISQSYLTWVGRRKIIWSHSISCSWLGLLLRVERMKWMVWTSSNCWVLWHADFLLNDILVMLSSPYFRAESLSRNIEDDHRSKKYSSVVVD